MAKFMARFSGPYKIIDVDEENSTVQVGAPHCAEPFDSRNGHTVPNDSDSMNS